MFGWRFAWGGRVEDINPEHRTYREISFSYERRDNVLWLTISLWWWTWSFRRLQGNRETGPAENRSVLSYFHGGKERRKKGRSYRDGFAQAAAKPTLTAAEIRKRNREQTIAKPLPYAWPGAELRPDGGIKLR